MYLQIENITKNWDNRGNVNHVLSNVSFSVEKNEFICIIGPSGCGKTTLLKIILGIWPASSGTVLLEGKKINKTCLCRAMVFQEPPLYPWKTVAQNIEIGLIFQKIDAGRRKKIVAEKIAITELNGYEDYYLYQLSCGMKQKTQLARVLALNPDIVLLDEPFAALDELLKHKFDIYLHKIWEQEKKTFILVTHSIEEAILLADRIFVMKPSPGEIHLEKKVEIPHPRDLFSGEIVKLRKLLRHELSKFY
jgi:NitT/TauT family transport system ATP-binding protein